MLGEDSTAGRYWQQVGEEAMRRGIKGVVFMGAHWEVGGSGVEIASNPGKDAVTKQPVAWVTPDKYVDYEVREEPCLYPLGSKLTSLAPDQLVSGACRTSPASPHRGGHRVKAEPGAGME